MNKSLCKNTFILSSMMPELSIPLQTMANFLLPDEVVRLILLHKKADKTQRDKIKAIFLLDKGYEYSEISEILLIDYTTIVWRWYEAFITCGTTELLKDNYQRGTSKLTEVQLAQLVLHLESTMYLMAKEICVFVKKTFKRKYTSE